MQRRSLITLFALLALIVATPAQAISYGEIDDGKHPNVGALIGHFSPTDETFVLCSGTLVGEARDLFLTAAHCVVGLPPDIEIQGVSFEDKPLENLGAMIAIDPDADITPHPDFPGPSSDPHDLAVIRLPAPVNIDPAELPTLNQLATMAKKNGLHGQKFTPVGYGALERTHTPGSGSPVFGEGGTRMFAISEFRALNKAWLQLSQNPSTGDGGTCFGDSGGPNFLGAGAGETDIIAAVTVTGDTVCRATNVVYRVDTPSAQEFLSGFGLVDPPSATSANAAKVTKESKDRKGGKRHRNRR